MIFLTLKYCKPEYLSLHSVYATARQRYGKYSQSQQSSYFS
jgi:hypothetical protein